MSISRSSNLPVRLTSHPLLLSPSSPLSTLLSSPPLPSPPLHSPPIPFPSYPLINPVTATDGDRLTGTPQTPSSYPVDGYASHQPITDLDITLPLVNQPSSTRLRPNERRPVQHAHPSPQHHNRLVPARPPTTLVDLKTNSCVSALAAVSAAITAVDAGFTSPAESAQATPPHRTRDRPCCSRHRVSAAQATKPHQHRPICASSSVIHQLTMQLTLRVKINRQYYIQSSHNAISLYQHIIKLRTKE